MDSPQSVVSPFKNLSVNGSEPEKQKSNAFVHASDHISNGTSKSGKDVHNREDFIGVLDVYVHQARDIQNICIYHKQDVYAKLCLTSDPENSISTQTINGGGQNPVFNDSVRLNVRTVDTSLKCEIWMLSRVRNYLEDQLLGYALVPLSDILFKKGKVEKEFSLSTSDIFDSPSGFVHLSLTYSGSSPDIMTISNLPDFSDKSAEKSGTVESGFDKIEFPDPKIINENQMMVSEYFEMECSLDSQTTESSVSSDTEIHERGVRVVESFSANSEESTYGSPSVCLPASSESSETQVTSKCPSEEHVSPTKDKKKDLGEGEGESSNGHPPPTKDTLITPAVTVNIESEEQMVQQDIVDMYMKSMQQFTDSLAKMKLPLDLTSEPAKSGNSSSDQTSETPKSTGSRVFYGSRAFF
ncbi:hypothetical protein RND81_04G171000 [Saponaria officinalis]|uniref:C2 domain-containing protein n=1 Tax=Saponaria officinalis TaxID=3572 RepID=A0AAW1LMZ7_SAPOF